MVTIVAAAIILSNRRLIKNGVCSDARKALIFLAILVSVGLGARDTNTGSWSHDWTAEQRDLAVAAFETAEALSAAIEKPTEATCRQHCVRDRSLKVPKVGIMPMFQVSCSGSAGPCARRARIVGM